MPILPLSKRAKSAALPDNRRKNVSEPTPRPAVRYATRTNDSNSWNRNSMCCCAKSANCGRKSGNWPAMRDPATTRGESITRVDVADRPPSDQTVTGTLRGGHWDHALVSSRKAPDWGTHRSVPNHRLQDHFRGPMAMRAKHLLRVIPVGTDPVSIQASRALRGLGRMHGVAPRDHHSRRGHSSPRGQEIKVVHISDQGRLACSHLTFHRVPTCATTAPIGVMADRTINAVPTCATMAPIDVMVDRTNRALFNFNDLTWPAATASAGRIPPVFFEECGHVAG